MSLPWPLFLLLIGAVSARVAITPRSDSEHVVIADCRSPSGFESSQYAYYSGSLDSVPDITTNMRVGKLQPWVGKGLLKATFADNTTFSCNFAASVSEGQFIGNGYRASKDYDRGWSSLACYARPQQALYTNEDGSVCDAVYVCDHSTPPVSKPVSVSPKGSPSTSSTSTPATTPATTPPAQETNNNANKNSNQDADADADASFGGLGAGSPLQTSASLKDTSSPSPSDNPGPNASNTSDPKASNTRDPKTSNTPDPKTSNTPDPNTSTITNPNTSTTTNPGPSNAPKFTPGEIAGIVIGGVSALFTLIGVIVAVLAWLLPKVKKRRAEKKNAVARFSKTSDGGSVDNTNDNDTYRSSDESSAPFEAPREPVEV